MQRNRFLRNVPFIGGFFDPAEQEAEALINQYAADVEGIGLPDYSGINYAPAQTIEEDASLLGNQRDFLRRMAYLSEQGFGPEERAAFEAAQNEAAQMAQAERAAIMENAAQRGAMGSGAVLALQQQAAQNAANQARASQLDTAAKMAQKKALMTQAYGGALAGVRGQDLQSKSANADILNRFNELNTDLAWRKKQQAYQDELAKMGLKGGVQTQRLQNLYGGSAAAAGNRAGLQQVVGQALGTASSALKSGGAGGVGGVKT